ncbi:hypothetical protein CKO22_11320 [Thiococcus pfennigii]|nr:hypothetical protein [Thiococcus pfennigii]
MRGILVVDGAGSRFGMVLRRWLAARDGTHSGPYNARPVPTAGSSRPVQVGGGARPMRATAAM